MQANHGLTIAIQTLPSASTDLLHWAPAWYKHPRRYICCNLAGHTSTRMCTGLLLPDPRNVTRFWENSATSMVKDISPFAVAKAVMATPVSDNIMPPLVTAAASWQQWVWEEHSVVEWTTTIEWWSFMCPRNPQLAWYGQSLNRNLLNLKRLSQFCIKCCHNFYLALPIIFSPFVSMGKNPFTQDGNVMRRSATQLQVPWCSLCTTFHTKLKPDGLILYGSDQS